MRLKFDLSISFDRCNILVLFKILLKLGRFKYFFFNFFSKHSQLFQLRQAVP